MIVPKEVAGVDRFGLVPKRARFGAIFANARGTR
jgi:hypothetical protein